MFVEDFSAFLDTTGGFAVTAAVLGQSVAGVFDNGYQAALLGAVESAAPSFLCTAASVAGVVQGTPVTVNATAYKVTTVEPDGTGMVLLILEQA